MTDPLDAVFVVGAEARLLELRDYIARMDVDKQLALKELIDSAVKYRLSKTDAYRAGLEAAATYCERFPLITADIPAGIRALPFEAVTP